MISCTPVWSESGKSAPSSLRASFARRKPRYIAFYPISYLARVLIHCFQGVDRQTDLRKLSDDELLRHVVSKMWSP